MADTNASAPPTGLAASVARALHELTSESPDVGALELLDDLHRLAAQAADARLSGAFGEPSARLGLFGTWAQHAQTSPARALGRQ